MHEITKEKKLYAKGDIYYTVKDAVSVDDDVSDNDIVVHTLCAGSPVKILSFEPPVINVEDADGTTWSVSTENVGDERIDKIPPKCITLSMKLGYCMVKHWFLSGVLMTLLGILSVCVLNCSNIAWCLVSTLFSAVFFSSAILLWIFHPASVPSKVSLFGDKRRLGELQILLENQSKESNDNDD